MIEIIVIVGLLVVILGQGVGQYLWRRETRKETQDLLDRIMATDYTQYGAIKVRTLNAEGELAKALKGPPALTEEQQQRLEDMLAEGVAI